MSILEIGFIVLFGLWFSIFLFPRLKSDYYLAKLFNKDTEQQVINFIKGIKYNDLATDINKVLYLYGLKKEGKVKKIVLMEEDGLTLIIRGYINSKEYIEFWAFQEDDIVSHHYKDGTEEDLTNEVINEVADKYKEYDEKDVLVNIKFLISNEDNLKFIQA